MLVTPCFLAQLVKKQDIHNTVEEKLLGGRGDNEEASTLKGANMVS